MFSHLIIVATKLLQCAWIIEFYTSLLEHFALWYQGIALRGLFIIDKEGVIQHSTINNLAIGRSVDETLRTLQVIMILRLCICSA